MILKYGNISELDFMNGINANFRGPGKSPTLEEQAETFTVVIQNCSLNLGYRCYPELLLELATPQL